MRRLVLALLLPLAAAGCKKSREDTCEQLANVGTAFANELGKRVGNKPDLGESEEIKAKMAEVKAECMQWPQEVFDCLHDNDDTSPKCREALQHVTGLVPSDVLKAPPGPRVVATADLGDVPWDGMQASLGVDGTVIALVEEGLVSYAATGRQNWRVLMEHDRWMLVEGDLVITGDRKKHEVVALDATTGEATWRAAVPQIDEFSDSSTEGGVRVGSHTYVPIADGRVLSIDPAACATKEQKGCVKLAFTLADEEFDNPQLFALGDDIVFAETTGIRRISTSGEVNGYIHVRDDLGGARLAGNERVAAIIDDELVMIDFAKCTGAVPIELRRKKGRMYIRGEGDCEECRAAPDGCVVRAAIDDLDSITPLALRDGSLIASNWDGPVRATATGKKQWASEADSVGPLREVGDAIVFLSRDDDDKPLRVAALDASTGKATWSSVLGGWKSKELSSSMDATVETNGNWIVVGVKGRIVWLKMK